MLEKVDPVFSQVFFQICWSMTYEDTPSIADLGPQGPSRQELSEGPEPHGAVSHKDPSGFGLLTAYSNSEAQELLSRVLGKTHDGHGCCRAPQGLE